MEYKKKQRPLKIRMLDGTVKTVMVDDSKTVTDMLMTICARIGERSGQQQGKEGSGGEMLASGGGLKEQSQLCSCWPGSEDVQRVCDTGEGTLPCTLALLQALYLAAMLC